MKIKVQNVNKPEINNHASVRVLSGANWSDHDLIIWEEIPGYIPLKMDGFSDWNRYVNLFGFSVFVCRST